jgi:hypothetical protein
METASIKQVLQLFNMLPKSEQLEFVNRISELTFEDRWRLIDSQMPDLETSEDDIMNEVRAVRYGNKKD